MKRREFDIEIESTAPAELLFDLLADAPEWPKWFGPVRKARWRDAGDPGVDSVRLVTLGPLTVQERVVAEERPAHYAYSIETVLPVRDHRADVWFAATGNETRIRWTSVFRPKVAGTGALVELGLRFGVRRLAAALCAEAERHSTARLAGTPSVGPVGQ